MFKWLFRKKRKEPIEHWASKNALITRYRNANNELVEVMIHPDPDSPATFLVKANGAVVARIWLHDNEISLGVSDVSAPIKYIG